MFDHAVNGGMQAEQEMVFHSPEALAAYINRLGGDVDVNITVDVMGGGESNETA